MSIAPYYDGNWTTPQQQGAKQVSFPLQAQKEYYAKEIVREVMCTAASYFPTIQNTVSAQNQILYSDDLTNAAWSLTAITSQANATIDPEGNLNASLVLETTATNLHYFAQSSAASFAASSIVSIGVFVKYSGRQYVCVAAQDHIGAFAAVSIVDLVNGVVSYTSVGSVSIKNVGNGWYWVVVSGPMTNAGTCSAVIGFSNVSNSTFPSYAGTAGVGGYFSRITFVVGQATGFPAIQTTATTRSVSFPPVDTDPDGNVFDPLAFLTSESAPQTAMLAKGIADWMRTYDRIPISQVIPTSYAFTAPSYQSATPSAVAVGNYGYVQGVVSGNNLALLNGYYDIAYATSAPTGTPPTTFTAAGSSYVAGDILLVNIGGTMYLALIVTSISGTYTALFSPTGETTSSAIVTPGYCRKLTINKTDYGQVVSLRAQILQDYYLPGFTQGIQYFTDIPAQSPYNAAGYLAAYATAVTTSSQTFTASGTFTVPAGIRNVQAYVIGGGGGGSAGGGGGGGGGVLLVNSFQVQPGQTIVVGIGAGGAGGTSLSQGNAGSGGNSTFGPFTAIGGGAGGYVNGIAGGSGGGSGNGAAFTGGAGTLGQGNAGGGDPSSYTSAAGGGGASAVGANAASNNTGGAGGAGIVINGIIYSAGGGGGGSVTGGAAGGTGAGAGSGGGVTGGAATANTGSGGGGGGTYGNGGNGGSGIVIVTWQTAPWFNVLSDGLKYWKGAILQRAYTQALLNDARPPSTYSQITASGTFTVPAGITVLRWVAMLGGGGGGGYGQGGGGGSGGVMFLQNVAVTPGQTFTVTIGPGGAGGTSGSPVGTNGTATYFGATYAGGGGGGGGSVNSTSAGNTGGAGSGAAGAAQDTAGTLGSGNGSGGGQQREGYGYGGPGVGNGGGTNQTGYAGYTAGGGGGGDSGHTTNIAGGTGTLWGNGGNGAGGASNPGLSAGANSGAGGGGGGTSSNGGAGGSGLVVVAY